MNMLMPAPARKFLTWERVLIVALSSLLALLSQAQDPAAVHKSETEVFTLGENQAITSCLELMPDGRTLLVGTTQDHPIYVVNVDDMSVQRTIAVSGYYAGPDIKASAQGTYLLVREKYYIDWNMNKDRQVKHEVMDFASGKVLFTLPTTHDAVFGPDEKSLYSLDGENVTVRSLPDGGEIGRIVVPQTRNSLAISPDGKWLAVSHRPTQPQLETVPSMRNDKSALKPALKYREMVSVYEVATGKLAGTIAEIYDVIYDMVCTDFGDRLLIYSIPHVKLQPAAGGFVAGGGRKGIVNVVDMPSMVPQRLGFMSLMNEPQLELNRRGSLLAMASLEGTNTRKLYVYDMSDGEFVLDLDMAERWRTSMKQGEYHDGNVPYHFLADGRTLVLGSGPKLRLLKIP